MPRVAPNLPAETDLLCEACGYTLNGLPEGGNCPECGKSIGFSVGSHSRQLSAWERDRRFLITTAEILFRPSRFFRSTATRGGVAAARQFGMIHTATASVLFAAAGTIHAVWSLTFETGRQNYLIFDLLGFVALALCTFAVMMWTTNIAARLTTWEATYRGIRLPLPVVQRGLAFHAAHYLPVALVALLTTIAYQYELDRRPIFWSVHVDLYLWVLSGEVIVGAAYLFHTYWIAMRKMMYANR